MSFQIDMARRRAAGFGFGPEDIWGDIDGGIMGAGGGIDRVIINTTANGDDSSDIPWYVSGAPVFGVIGKTLSNIFGNQYQQPTAVGLTAAQLAALRGNQVVPAGYGYNASGQLVKQSLGSITDFVSNNPLLVGAVVIGGLLLFMRPPGRR